MYVTLVILALSLLVYPSGCASRLLYYPDRKLYQTPSQQGQSFEDVTFASRDGTLLSGWFIPAKGHAKGTVIHFHGNAQNMTAHYLFVDWIPAEGFNLFTFDYRGYGRSGGKPQRQGVYNDCVAAIRYVQSRADVDPNTVLVLGQSLGGANALAVLGENRIPGVRAVAIDSTFYSYRTIVRDKIAAIPVLSLLKWPLSYLLISNEHSPGTVVQNIAPTPLVLIHGDSDRVIPYHHAQDLFAKAREPKHLWTVEKGDHTEALVAHGLTYRRKLVDFFNAALDHTATNP